VKKIIIAAAAAAAFLPVLASAQFAKTEDAINYRQSALFIVGQHFGRIGAMVNDKIPFDAARAKESAGIVNVVAQLPWAAFVPNSDKGDTKARPEVWEDSGKFKSAQERLAAALPKLTAAAETGDKAQIKEAFGETASACKNCHDSFRAK
jgi:cytochrome c556